MTAAFARDGFSDAFILFGHQRIVGECRIHTCEDDTQREILYG